ncbi:zinc finger CCCH domain-containing protein 48-like [Hevea brasiliensis]|uniref:zinc finger CCCH domain-containing protein 48-like n=1 Tax=Hevea brasiliensis TaxID=3981 RepID=UPI0025F89884|nr:zinc finger CCCH domain-containing protein 48-like [Hevea brasiliensis]
MDISMRTINPSKPFHAEQTRKSFQDQPRKPLQRICKFWVKGKCAYKNNCRFLHSWFQSGNGLSMLARLEGHKKSVVGVALPSRSDKLYRGSRDGTVRVWDCYSGKCDRIINLGFEIGSLICEGLWVFIGLPNLVRVWNLSSEGNKEFSLNGLIGQVYALAVYKDLLFTRTATGDILAWKGSFEANSFAMVATLRTQKGSMDNTVKVWDLETMQCKQTLNGHKDVVMSLLSWDQCLLTCSLEHTMKFWVAREGGKLEPVNTLEEKIFAEKEVREIQRDPNGLFFTGDAARVLTVWMWQAE